MTGSASTSAADSRGRALLDFEEVSHRLGLGTRVDVGRQEVAVRQVIGSVGRALEFDRNFRPLSRRLEKLVEQIRANRPNAADDPIQLYEVDQAYFVVDGHKRMSLAVAEGREYIDAEVTRFFSRFHVDAGTTIDTIRSTEEEVRFREETGLLRAVPEARFPMADPDGYLDLKESVKAHSYDLSLQRGQLVPPPEAAKHWYEVVFQVAIAIARDGGYDQMLRSCSEAELFLIMRHGNRDRFGPNWEMRTTVVDRSRQNLRAAARPRVLTSLARLLPGRRGQPGLLSEDAERHETDS